MPLGYGLLDTLISSQIPVAGSKPEGGGGSDSKDDSFREFRRLCADIAEENSYTGKTAIIKKFITKGTSGGENYCNFFQFLLALQV